MNDFDTHELNDPVELDAAFAQTFGLGNCQWAQGFDQDAVTDFLQALTGRRRIWKWTLEFRNWNHGQGSDYEGMVSSETNRGGAKHGHKGWGFSDYACHALMKAAIQWDQRRRERDRRKAAARRESSAT